VTQDRDALGRIEAMSNGCLERVLGILQQYIARNMIRERIWIGTVPVEIPRDDAIPSVREREGKASHEEIRSSKPMTDHDHWSGALLEVGAGNDRCWGTRISYLDDLKTMSCILYLCDAQSEEGYPYDQ
jgi:hypothetical protein